MLARRRPVSTRFGPLMPPRLRLAWVSTSRPRRSMSWATPPRGPASSARKALWSIRRVKRTKATAAALVRAEAGLHADQELSLNPGTAAELADGGRGAD